MKNPRDTTTRSAHGLPCSFFMFPTLAQHPLSDKIYLERTGCVRPVPRPRAGGGRAAPGMLPGMDVNGTAAIVSGGASGLGEATARVVIVDLNEDAGKRVASETGGLFARTDVADEASVQAAVDAAAGTGA